MAVTQLEPCPLDQLAAVLQAHLVTSGLHIYGSIGLTGRLRNVPFEARFLVCRISDNAILGMEFLSRHDCSVACDKGLLVMGGKTIQCTDWMGRLQANKVQVTRTLTEGTAVDSTHNPGDLWDL